jgi:hypothetical protein
MTLGRFAPSLLACCLVAQDHLLHMTTSFALSAAAQRTFGRTEGLVIGIAAGVVKELTDDRVDGGDLAADALGVLLTVPFEF